MLNNNFIRILPVKNVFSIDSDNIFRLHQTSEIIIFEIVKSKIETLIPEEGKSKFTVLEKNYTNKDLGFAKALVPLKNLTVFFDKVIDHPYYGVDKVYNLNIGDILVYTGIDYKKIILNENNYAEIEKDFLIRTFPIGEKSKKIFVI